MLTLLIIIMVALVIAVPIGLVALRINGDDGKPWEHGAGSGEEDDRHRWEE